MYTKPKYILQSNLNSSNTDGSFTMENSNSFLHYENTPIQIYRKFHLQKLKIFR